MSNEEKEDYLKYIENYTLNDLADEFNTQNFIIKDKDKFNEILLYYHFKEVDEIEQLQQENEKLKDNWIKLKEYIRKNIIYDDVGMKILDSSPLEDYMQELEQGSDNK